MQIDQPMETGDGEVEYEVADVTYRPDRHIVEDQRRNLIQEAIDALAGWVTAGEIAWREDIQEGFEEIPATLQRLFDGRNTGKQLLKLADPD